jgi:hypothetical protein
MGDSLKEIAVLLIGVALVALLVNKASGTVSIIGAGTQGFGNLLRIVTLQNSGGFTR